MQTRLAVLMMADMVDYSRLMERDQSAAIGAIRDLKRTHLEPEVIANNGEVLKRMGDGWVLAFSSVSAAINCSMTVQKKLADHKTIKLRLGAHIGEITEDENDFYGPGVNLAQRIQTEAPPGGLMISQDLYRQLPGELAADFKDAGSFKLKNIALPVNLFHWRPQKDTSSRADDVPTITIEPFTFAPDDTETRAAVADLRDQLIRRVSQRTGIRVLDDASSQATDATYRLRGRLRLAGTRGRLSLSLVLRDDGAATWSQVYEGDPTDIFQFCDDLIERAEADLRTQINAFDGDRISHLPDDELSVSELRSRAASSFYKPTVDSWEYAQRLLERAIVLHRSDPMALAMRAEAIIILAQSRFETLPPERVQELEVQLNDAIVAAPRSDYVFWVRSLFKAYVLRDSAAAEEDVRRTLLLSPAYAPGYELLGSCQLLAEKLDDADANLRKAIALSEADPLLSYRLYLLAICSFCQDNFEAALEATGRAIQLQPNQRLFYALRALLHERSGDSQRALEARSAADALPRAPSILAPRPPVSDSHEDLVSVLMADL